MRISLSQSASNLKIRPRHITTKWEGQGPSLSESQHNTHVTDRRALDVGYRSPVVVYRTCFEVIMDLVLCDSRYFAGVVQHSELVHV